jgi:hypothetical protein
MTRRIATRESRSRTAAGLLTLALSVLATGIVSGQGAIPSTTPKEAAEQANDLAGFNEFTIRVEAYVKLQKTVESSLPGLGPTDLPEMITAHQQALARKIREARPHAKAGDVFTSAASEAFRHATHAVLDGPHSAASRAYMQPGAPNPGMRLTVNEVYPDTEPYTVVSPELLAALPPLPAEVAYVIVGRALILIDVQSRLIVDVARLVLPPVS